MALIKKQIQEYFRGGKVSILARILHHMQIPQANYCEDAKKILRIIENSKDSPDPLCPHPHSVTGR